MPEGKAIGRTRFRYTSPSDVTAPVSRPPHRTEGLMQGFRGVSGVFLQEQKRFFQVVSLGFSPSTIPSFLFASPLIATQWLRNIP